MKKLMSFSKTGYSHLFLMFILMGLFSSCSCKKETVVSLDSEETLKVKISTSAIETSPANTYSFSLALLSAMPKDGVEIFVEIKREDNQAIVYSVKRNSNDITNYYTITNLPMGQISCIASVTVTSKSKPVNVWNGSFRIFWK